jgi:hypothetical protein
MTAISDLTRAVTVRASTTSDDRASPVLLTLHVTIPYRVAPRAHPAVARACALNSKPDCHRYRLSLSPSCEAMNPRLS